MQLAYIAHFIILLAGLHINWCHATVDVECLSSLRNSISGECSPPWRVMYTPLDRLSLAGDQVVPANNSLASRNANIGSSSIRASIGVGASAGVGVAGDDGGDALPPPLLLGASVATRGAETAAAAAATAAATAAKAAAAAAGGAIAAGVPAATSGWTALYPGLHRRSLLQYTGGKNAWPKGCGAGDVNPMLSPNRVAGGQFGYSLSPSAHGVYVAIGQPQDVDNMNGTGKAFAFQTVRQGAGCAYKGVQLDQPFDLGFNFGLMSAVSYDGNWMLVAARLDKNWGPVFPVYVYKRTTVWSPVTGAGATKWVLTQRLPIVRPPATASQTTYPGSIGLSSDGRMALVSWYTDEGSDGSAQLFRRGPGPNAKNGTTNPDRFVLFQHLRPPTPVGSIPSDYGGVATISSDSKTVLVSDSANVYAYRPGAGVYGQKYLLFDTVTGDEVSIKLNPNLGQLINVGSALQIAAHGGHFAATTQLGDPENPTNVVLLFQLRGKGTFYDMKCVIVSPVGNFFSDQSALSMVQTNKYFLKLGIGVGQGSTLDYTTAFVYRFSTDVNTVGLKTCQPLPELQFINPLASSAGSLFGKALSVSLDGRVTLVGAPLQDVNRGVDVGATFIYDTYNYQDDPTWHGAEPGGTIGDITPGYSYDYLV